MNAEKLLMAITMVVITILSFSTLCARVDFTLEDSWELEGMHFDTFMPLGNDRYYSLNPHSVIVFELSGTNLQKLQTFYSVDMLSMWYNSAISGNTLYVATQYANILAYQILPDYSLEFLGEIPLQAGPNELDHSMYLYAQGNILVHSVESYATLDYSSPQNYMDVYDVSDISAPQLLHRHLIEGNRPIIAIHAVADGYYLCSILHEVFFSADLIDLEQSNLLEDAGVVRQTNRTLIYGDKLHLLETAGTEVTLSRYSLEANHQFSLDWTMALPNVNCGGWMVPEENRISVLGRDYSINKSRLLSYATSDSTWTLTHNMVWPSAGLMPIQDGYLSGGENILNLYDSDFNLVHEISNTPYERAISLIKGRWMLFRGQGPMYSQSLRIFDLQTRQWLDTQFLKYDYISSLRHDSNNLCLYNGQEAILYQLQDDGNHQLRSFDTGSTIEGMDVWGDRMAILQYSDDDLLYHVKAYDISSGSAVQTGLYPMSGGHAAHLMFYSPMHFTVLQSGVGSPILRFFRIEEQGSVSYLGGFDAVGFSALLQHDDRILVGRESSPVFDVSDPDNPHVSFYTEPMVPSTVYSGLITYDSEDNYLSTGLIYAPSYIIDYQGNELDYYFSPYSFYRAPNRIILQGSGYLLEVSHQDYVAVDDPLSPKPINLLGHPYPNPFSDHVKSAFVLEQPAATKATVYNIRGQKVRNLLDSYRAKGSHELTWDG
ncbi:MAG TPA: hypothetical protein PKI59_03065, partial [Candidatus Cloacimonadota bacterium]|nr:hypothetical protein [Candidatus Cloacimonadota bacterium]